MKMKKVLSGLLLGAVALGLVACGSGDKKEESKGSSEASGKTEITW